MDATTLLANTLSPDNGIRQSAQDQLDQAKIENFPAYMHTLATELSKEGSDPNVRNAAGLAFKNTLSAKESTLQQDYLSLWRSLPLEQKTAIKTLILRTLDSSDRKAAGVAAQSVAAIAAVELPFGEWPELIGQLLEFVGSESAGLRVATLQSVGYICEVINPEILQARSNEILTAVVQGARKEETSTDVQAAAVQALFNSLEFIKDNFDREGERNYIMQVVCEATQNPSIPVQVGAFECLVRIMSLYYDKMALYMERALFGLTVLGMQNPEEKVALQAVEFWSTVCDEEQELALEAAEAAEYGDAPSMQSRNFAKTALPEILPVILALLLKQDEDAEEDEWNVAMAAGTCLGLLAGVVSDAIVQPTIPFIEANIKGSDWHQREAAVMAFGSILDGPDADKLTPLVQQALPTLIGMMRDPQADVKETVAWCIGKITELMIESIQTDVHLPELISALIYGLEDPGRVATHSAWAIKNLVSQLGTAPDLGPGIPTSSVLSPYYPTLLQKLLQQTEARTDNEANGRTAAYEAISDMAFYSAQDTLELVSQLGVEILTRMEKLLSLHNQLLGPEDRDSWNELQVNCCTVISNITRKLNTAIEPLADRMMTVLLQLLRVSMKNAAVAEDAFMTIGALVNVSGPSFEKYVPHLMEFLYPALSGLEEYSVFSTSVGLAGDLARGIGNKFLPYTDNVLQALLTALASPVLHRVAKPTVVSAFGDIALALEQAFTPYLEHVMNMLSQAGAVQVDENADEAMADFVWAMRESIVEAFIGILSGYHEDPTPFAPYVSGVVTFIVRINADDEVSDSFVRNSMELLADLTGAYRGTATKDQLLTEGVGNMLAQARGRGYNKSTMSAIKRAKKAIKEISQ